jgi:ATP-dependent Clp protease, protease subunit
MENDVMEGCFCEEELLTSQNSLFLFDEIDKYSSKEIITKLLWMDQNLEDDKIVKFYINSYGGNLGDTFAIIATIESISKKVVTIGLGKVASGAAALLMSGTGGRFIFPRTRVVLHGVFGGYDGDYTSLKNGMIEHEKVQSVWVKYISEKTKKTEERIREDIDRDVFLSAEEALEYGIIDGIISKIEYN